MDFDVRPKHCLLTMAIFQREPRHILSLFSFYTTPIWSRRIFIGGITITVTAVIVMILSTTIFDSGHPVEAFFLITSAWVLIFGVFRLFASSAMYLFSKVFDWFGEAIPRTANAMHLLERSYWIFFEVFLTTAFLGLLVASVFAAAGISTLN